MAIFLKKIIEKLNTVIAVSERKRLSVNFANFGLFQIINYIVPLVTIPFIVRMNGTNLKEAMQILEESGLNITFEADLIKAAETAVSVAKLGERAPDRAGGERK